MSLWSIHAAKKQEDVPGSSKWIRKELCALHELIANDVEQFAYSVASEFTWIDEQMELIVNDRGDNPMLLLESPKKLRGENSPIKKLREQAIQAKHPLEEISANRMSLSPIKYNHRAESPSKSTFKHESPAKKSPVRLWNRDILVGLDQPHAVNPQFSILPDEIELEKEEEHEKNISVSRIQREQQKPQENPIKIPKSPYPVMASTSPEHSAVSSAIKKPQMERDEDYDASMDEDISFQAIRKSIRRSIIRRTVHQDDVQHNDDESNTSAEPGAPDQQQLVNSINSEPQEKSVSLDENSVSTVENSETSFKSASNEQQSSLVVNQGSTSVNGSLHDTKSSIETLKLSLISDDHKDNSSSSTIKPMHTSPINHRESQGFALLPQRNPLTIKSAKRTNKTKVASTNDLKVSLNKRLELSPLKPFTSSSTVNSKDQSTTSLSPLPKLNQFNYPSLEVSSNSNTYTNNDDENNNNNNNNNNISPIKNLIKDDKKEKEKNDEFNIFISPTKRVQPLKQPTNSPLSNLFSSVGSTLRKARNYLKDDRSSTKVNDFDKIRKPIQRKISLVEKPESSISSGSPTKIPIRSVSPKPIKLNSEVEISNNQLRGDLYPKLNIPIKLANDNSNSINSESTLMNENEPTASRSSDEFNTKQVSFSPAKSVYGSLRFEMNKTSSSTTTTPNLDDKSQTEEKLVQQYHHQPISLTRVSLTKKDEPRKSTGKGLTSVALDPSNKSNRFRPKSLVHGDNQPLKRRTQTEDEIKNSYQPFRKIPSKVPQNISHSKHQLQQLQQHQNQTHTQTQQENRHNNRLTSEKLTNGLKKRPSRVSGQKGDEEKEKQKPAIKLKYPTNQTLMKTAVLQNAQQQKSSVKNPFQISTSTISSSSSSVINKNNPPVTPTAATVLPEIFSESDDDDEGSVLKAWANSPELRNILINQQNVDPDKVFGPLAPLKMEEIFKTSKVSRFKRGSSAQWSGKDALSAQEIEDYKTKTYK